MALNLNKTDESNSSKSTDSSSRFDLSKKDSSQGGNEGSDNVTSTKSKTPLYIIGSVLILGAIIWYFFNQPTAKEVVNTPETNMPAIDSVKAATQDAKVSNLASDTTKKSNPEIIAKEINNKVPVEFPSGSSEVNSVDDAIVANIIKLSNSNSTVKIRLNGFASSEGDLATNKVLSKKRADSFKEFLVAKGIAADKISCFGMGVENPIAANETESGRVKNRRVEIIIE